jgi:hypothetical protein
MMKNTVPITYRDIPDSSGLYISRSQPNNTCTKDVCNYQNQDVKVLLQHAEQGRRRKSLASWLDECGSSDLIGVGRFDVEISHFE